MIKTIKRITLFLLMSLFLSLFSMQNVKAQYSEYETKAAFLHAFAKFVSWPPELFKESNEFVIGILGDDPYGKSIDRIVKNRPVKGRYFTIRRATTVRELKGCHIVFISRSERKRIREILQEINSFKGASVLTVGDNIDEFCKFGGVINFTDDRTKRFSYNLGVGMATKKKLVLDGRLLKLADQIITNTL